MANLVIVESPAKANTIKGYLGSNYKVIASKGHIRDLPKSTLGIDVESGFLPHYINIRGKGDVINELKREAKGGSKIFLATDPDREGEAISWHIANQLGIPEDKACRVTFNEITKSAVKEAIKAPRKINMDLVNSQQARRILDRLVGFNLSQILWKNVGSGLSGGRVQSVAARIISEREQEIRDFEPKEYWTVDATLRTADGDEIEFRFFGNKHGKLKIQCKSDADAIVDAVNKTGFSVLCVKHSEKHRHPSPPFTTSTMQQEASRKLGFQSHKTMKIAQELYDGLNLGSELGGVQGLITYMRTDSTRISPIAQQSAREYIMETFGQEFLPKHARIYKTKNGAQDAHEAIRPSNIELSPKRLRKVLTQDQYKLYKLIWERFLASQMEGAVIDGVSVDVESAGYVFRTAAYNVKSQGYTILYDSFEEIHSDEDDHITQNAIPVLEQNQELITASVKSTQHFTEPPARYTESALIKFLEENGIGRPSTYAPIISIIISRDYVRREGKSLVATKLGEVTTEFMKTHFPEVVDYEFTAFMEEQLDSIERNENTISGVIGGFYDKFSKELAAVESKGRAASVSIPAETSEYNCSVCGKPMVYKNGRFGKFLACSNYPQCNSTITVDKNGAPKKPKDRITPEATGLKCEKCGSDMVIRNGKFGEFYACGNYPVCKFTKPKVDKTGIKCPKCNEEIVVRRLKGKTMLYSCSAYPLCDFSSWDKPLEEKCPQCNSILYYRKTRNSVICKNKGCSYKPDNAGAEDNE